MARLRSLAGKIHISASAKQHLYEADSGFVIEERGDILIKGKGERAGGALAGDRGLCNQ